MGDPRKPRKKYEVPRRQWDRERIDREKKLIAEYGLKNHRELWRMQTILRQLRREARALLAGEESKVAARRKQLLDRAKRFFLQKTDLQVDDVLALDVRSVLDRRIQSIVHRRRLARTPRQARQFVVHGHIALAGQRVTTPSYLVPFSAEDRLEWYREAIAAEPAPEAAAPAAPAAPAAAPAPAEAPSPAEKKE
jgi:small subunit ribosomal protein S4